MVQNNQGENTERQAALEDFLQAALPALEALESLYGPVQQRQPDSTGMYWASTGKYLYVGDVRRAIQALALAKETGLIAPPLPVAEQPAQAPRKRKSA